MSQLTQQEAIKELGKYGITGKDVYLVDVIPVIEIVWASGSVQDSEKKLLDKFVRKHVQRINGAAGEELLSLERARSFVDRFLFARPDKQLMKTLRNLVAPARRSGENRPTDLFRESILAACLDVASSAVREYPFGPHDRFDLVEKMTFFEILKSLPPK